MNQLIIINEFINQYTIVYCGSNSPQFLFYLVFFGMLTYPRENNTTLRMLINRMSFKKEWGTGELHLALYAGSNSNAFPILIP